MKRLFTLLTLLTFSISHAQILVSNGHPVISNAHPILTSVGAAPPAVVQSNAGTFTTGTTTTVPGGLSSLPVSGHAIVVAYTAQDTGYANLGCSSVVDSASNSFTKLKDEGSTGQGDTQIWWLPSVGTTSGSYTITCTLGTASSIGGATVTTYEVSGLTGHVDQSAGGASGAGTTTETATASAPNTTATDFEISSIAVSYDPGAATSVPTGFTSTLNSWGATGNIGFTVSYRLPSSIETASATWTWTNSNRSGYALVTLY